VHHDVSIFREKPLSERHSFHPEDGGKKALRSVGILSEHYTPSQLRRPRIDLEDGKEDVRIILR
jgi:hypothetical protein